jgi:hypothetical protein
MPPRDSPHLKNNFTDHELLANPERYHSKDSPYFGLSVKHQSWLAKKRRPKGPAPKYIKYSLREATPEDYQYILTCCTKMLILASQDHVDTRLDRIDIDLELIWNYRKRFPDDFPRGIVLAYDDWTIFVRFKVDKIINWLYNHGHSAYTSSQLRKNLWAMKVSENISELAFYDEFATYGSINQLFSTIIGDAESGSKVDRWGKGRRTYRSKVHGDGTVIAQEAIDKPSNVCFNVGVVKMIDEDNIVNNSVS